MTAECPLVTIITPVYRYRPTIKECIQSVMSQDYCKIEYIIIDDGPGSVDEDEIKPWLTRNDVSVKIIHNEKNEGISETLNIGIRNSSGDIIFNLADDDEFYDSQVIKDWVNQFIKTGAEVITARRSIIVNGVEESVSPSLRQIKMIERKSCRLLLETMSGHNDIFGSVTAKRRSLFEAGYYYNPNYRLIEDYPHNMLLLRNKKKIHTYDRIVIKYRVGGISDKANINEKYLEESDRIFDNEILPYVRCKMLALHKYRKWKKSIGF